MADYCTKKIKAQYDVWPSARASQAVAKCRKERGDVRKSEKGASLRRWTREEWIDRISGRPCGAGGDAEYCRPTNIVSREETPSTRPPERETRAAKARKRAGLRAQPTKTPDR